ncbi:AAA family ATPase [Actinosynnema sp. NPDC091369]
MSGLTAAGKTTLCRRLAASLRVPYFSASQVLREHLSDANEEWSPQLDLRRTELSVERAVDAAVIRALRDREAGVFDSWGSPWYSDEPATRIWLESDRESRLRKCFVSYVQRGTPKTSEDCAAIVDAKDAMSRAVFLANWGFDIVTDRRPFDLVVDCSAQIPEATVAQAELGARATYRAVVAALADRGLVDRVEPADTGAVSEHGPVVRWRR